MLNKESNFISIEAIEQAITNLKSFDIYINKHEEIKNLKLKSQNNELVVSVMGAMKSGKSTFINSLIGCDLMPNENAACTFTTTELFHGKSNDVEIKKIFQGRTEIIKGNSVEETASLFHDDVKRNRTQQQESFKYAFTYPLCGIKKKESKDNFVIVDTPGLNEMSGLGVDKSEIQTLFGKVLKRTDYIFFIIDYQYYKAEENVAILDEIKMHRKEIIENNNIVFVLNKIDAQTDKDGSIDQIFDDVSSVLKSWGIIDPKLYSISAKKALYSRLIKNNMIIDEEDLKRYLKPVEKKISDKIFFFLPKKSSSQAAILMKDSNLQTFENDVLNDLYTNANEYAAMTNKELTLSIANEITNNTENKIHEIEELLKPILLRKMELNKAHSKIKEINSLITSKAQDFTKNISEKIQKSRNEVTYIPECDMRYSSAKTFTWGDIKYTSKAKNYYKVTSESSAESTGKNEYYYWTDKIKIPWEKIYVHYSEKLRYDNDNSNMFYLINTNACAILKELENKTTGLLKDLDCRDSLSFMSNINIMPEPLEKMTDDNTKNYYPYKSNSDLVKIECMEDYLEGVLWGTNNAYKYDIRPAQEEQKKDIDKALRLSSEHFKKDYINKATVTLDKINMLFREQITKALLTIEKIEKEYSGHLSEIQKEEVSLQNKINKLHQIKATVSFSSLPQSSTNIKSEGFFSRFFRKSHSKKQLPLY